MIIYVDGDACPVKEEIYRLALRHDVRVLVVSHGPLHVPARGRIEGVRVRKGFDAVDDWIAAQVAERDLVVTADIPLADRCLKKGARVLAPNGHEFTADSIGGALATRELMDQLRQMGAVTGGPAAFAAGDRTRFLSRLGEAIHAARIDPPPGSRFSR
jgi:hypothetical protein